MTLQISQLLGLASQAGFSGADLATAVAVALAESSGNPDAYNPERAAGAAEGHGSFGLWQIYLEAHPEFAGQNLFDPQTNAAAAYAVYSAAGNSFRPWSTFVSGAYLTHLEAVNQALQGSPGGTSGDGGFPTTDLVTVLVVGGIVVYFAGRLLGW
jgi:Lysozyme like domain